MAIIESRPSAREEFVSTDKVETRTPRQQRSIERVDAILQAAKELIVEKGSAGLKIQEIAQRAGITAGSMYQYFPNKAAIIHALGQQYLDLVNNMLKMALVKKPETLQECVDTLHILFDQFHALNCHDPVIRDIWVSTSADKNLQDMDIEDSRRNAALLFEHMKALFPAQYWPAMERLLFLSMHLCGATIRLALSVEKEEGHEILQIAKQMITVDLLEKFTDA